MKTLEMDSEIFRDLKKTELILKEENKQFNTKSVQSKPAVSQSPSKPQEANLSKAVPQDKKSLNEPKTQTAVDRFKINKKATKDDSYDLDDSDSESIYQNSDSDSPKKNAALKSTSTAKKPEIVLSTKPTTKFEYVPEAKKNAVEKPNEKVEVKVKQEPAPKPKPLSFVEKVVQKVEDEVNLLAEDQNQNS